MTKQSAVTPGDFMELLRNEQTNPFVQAVKPQAVPEAADMYAEEYAALRREFDADMYGRVSLKRIATLSR